MLDNALHPEFVFVNLSQFNFPQRMNDLPHELKKFFMTTPRVKAVWNELPSNVVDEFNVRVVYGIDDTSEFVASQSQEVQDEENSESEQRPVVQTGFNWLKQAYDYLTSDVQKCFLKIIIPCWGVESEVGKMLDSILSQSFDDYKVVCVEDCSKDGTLGVLKSYEEKHKDKITVMQNPRNLGAGESRNRGFFNTLTTIPSEYVWVVDADDYLADSNVFQKIHDFAIQNPNYDIINVGWTCKGEYSIARLGWPIGLPGRVIRPCVYVAGIGKNIPFGNDVYSHFIMFDQTPGEKIGYLDYNCYVYPKPGRHINDSAKTMDVPRELGTALMSHKFQKQIVLDEIMNGRSGTGKWIKRHFPEFGFPSAQRGRKTSILMASFPFRRKWMLKCIGQLIDQCDNFYLWLNEYDEIPSELNKYSKRKLHVTLGDKNLKENGRYLFLNKECKDDYCFICDDDINYPPNYVENTLKCFERNGDNIVAAYYIHNNNSFLAEHKEDTVENILMNSRFVVVPHYRFGLGVAAFVPSVTRF